MTVENLEAKKKELENLLEQTKANVQAISGALQLLNILLADEAKIEK